MRIPALVAAVALVIGACQTASADFVAFAAGTSAGAATAPVLDSANLFTQTADLSSDVFGTPNSSTATFSYSGLNLIGPGSGTFNWTITNTGSESYTSIIFELDNFVDIGADSVEFTAAGNATFSSTVSDSSVEFFGGTLAPGDSHTFVLVAAFADLADLAAGTFDLSTTAVPEPSSLILLGVGTVLAGGCWARRRRAKAKTA